MLVTGEMEATTRKRSRWDWAPAGSDAAGAQAARRINSVSSGGRIRNVFRMCDSLFVRLGFQDHPVTSGAGSIATVGAVPKK